MTYTHSVFFRFIIIALIIVLFGGDAISPGRRQDCTADVSV